MKTSSAAVVAAMLLAACVVTRGDREPVVSRRAAPSTLISLRSAVSEMEHLADDVDTALRLGADQSQSDDRASELGWIPAGTHKRAGGKRRSGRRRYDAYGVAGRFGRSAE